MPKNAQHEPNHEKTQDRSRLSDTAQNYLSVCLQSGKKGKKDKQQHLNTDRIVDNSMDYVKVELPDSYNCTIVIQENVLVLRR